MDNHRRQQQASSAATSPTTRHSQYVKGYDDQGADQSSQLHPSSASTSPAIDIPSRSLSCSRANSGDDKDKGVGTGSVRSTPTTTASGSFRSNIQLTEAAVSELRIVDSPTTTKTTTTTGTKTDNVYSRCIIDDTTRDHPTTDMSDLDEVVCVDDLEKFAKSKLDKSIYDYYTGGADDEQSLRWNRSMIREKYCLRPRVLCDVSQIDLTKYVFGDRLSMPIGISPTAMHKMAHPGGEKAMVRAANRINACMILSLFSTTSLEDVAKQAPICPKWQNIYILKNRDITHNVINRAIRYGYRAIVVTCDAPTLGYRRKDVLNNFTLGEHTLENIEDQQVKALRDHASEIFDPSITWQDLAELKKSVGDTIRVIAKGIMTPEDARHAVEAGVDGIFVSNHGGRQLDGCQSTIEALPAVVRAVSNRCPVFVDGGFRTGADILKALALGADMVFVGRPPLMGLAAFGEEGVFKAMKMLHDELRRAMMLCGCSKLTDINRSMVIERI